MSELRIDSGISSFVQLIRDGLCSLISELRNFVRTIDRFASFYRSRAVIDIAHSNVTTTKANGRECSKHPFIHDDPVSDEVRKAIQDAAAVELRLNEREVLFKRVTLPKGAERNLATALELQIERFIPVPLSDLVFDFSVVSRDSVKRQITVELAFAKRKRVEEVSAFVRGIDPSQQEFRVLCVHGAQTYHFRKRHTHGALWRSPNLILLCLCLALVAGLWFEDYSGRANKTVVVDAEITSLAPAMSRLTGMLDDVRAREDTVEKLLASRSKVPVLKALNEVSRLLPQGTWLESWSLDTKTLVIRGYSDNALPLLSVLGGSELFQDARFSAPTTQAPRSKLDRFEITLRLGGVE